MTWWKRCLTCQKVPSYHTGWLLETPSIDKENLSWRLCIMLYTFQPEVNHSLWCWRFLDAWSCNFSHGMTHWATNFCLNPKGRTRCIWGKDDFSGLVATGSGWAVRGLEEDLPTNNDSEDHLKAQALEVCACFVAVFFNAAQFLVF